MTGRKNDNFFFIIVDVVTNQKDVMKCIMSRENDNVSILLLIDIDQFFPVLEKICQSIQYRHLINIIPVGKKKKKKRAKKENILFFFLICISDDLIIYSLL